MNLVLTRNLDGRRADGIFSVLAQDDAGREKVAATVEHAYITTNGCFQPKIPNGVFDCVRGIHALEDGVPFETFEITGVEGHSGLLFHWGNYNKNSKGCVCTGEDFVDAPKSSVHEDMVTNSRATFAKLMTLQTGVDRFQLTVTG